MYSVKRGFVAVISLAACLGLFTGCQPSLEKLAQNQTDTELFEQGKAYYDQGDYKNALEYFLYVKENFIRSSYASLSRFYAGNCYFSREDYENAALEYQSFLMFFPDDPLAPEAQYKLGVSHFEQARGPERDQSMLHKALEELQDVWGNYPDATEFIAKAEEYIQKTENELAQHELAIALFYRKNKDYTASNGRLEFLIQEYPESGLVGDALYYQGINALELEQPDLAKAAFSRLLQEYPENSHVPDARQHLQKLSGENPQSAVDSNASKILASEETKRVPSLQNPDLQGTILTVREQTVTTTLIRDDGIREGMQLKVYHDGNLVGILRITVIHEGFSMGEIETIAPGAVVQEDDYVCCPEPGQ